MHGNFSHRISIIRWTALALLGLCFVQLPARAQAPGGQDSIWIDIGSPLGIAPGQTLRINMFNPLAPAPPGEDGRKYKMLFAPLILDADGHVIARRDEITLDPGQFHSFDFKRADLPLAGEAGTGRVQTRAQIRYRSFYLVDRTRAIGFSPTSIELIDNSTGRTTAVWVTTGFFEVVPPRNPQ